MGPFSFWPIKMMVFIFSQEKHMQHFCPYVRYYFMKPCKGCKEVKSLDDFHDDPRNKDGKRNVCKVCMCQKARDSYQRNKESAKIRCAKAAKVRILERRKFVYSYLTEHPCVQCGESDPVVLEFDHIDRDIKDANICRAIWANWSMKRLLAEIAKCQVLCANCHRRKTAKDLGWYSFLTD